MNTEERHHLNTSELGKVVQVAGYRLEEHATKIVVAICTVLVVAATITWWSRQTSSATIGAWSLLETAKSIDDYGLVVEKYKGTLASQWAKLRESEMHLQSGMPNMFSDRELALSDLKRARSGFEELLAEKSLDALIRERALWGLAQSLETTNDGDTTKAVDAYKQLLNEFPDTIYKSLAQQRVTELQLGTAKEFYSWFAKQSPKPNENRPKDGEMKSGGDSKSPFEVDFAPNPPRTDTTSSGRGSEKPATTDSDQPAAEKSAETETKPETPATDPKGDAAKPDDKPTEENSTTQAESEKSDPGAKK